MYINLIIFVSFLLSDVTDASNDDDDEYLCLCSQDTGGRKVIPK